MICPECNGRGEAIYYVETGRDENTVTVEQRKGICRTCNGSGEKPQTNADRIRSMSDEEMAWELMTWRLEAVARYHGVESQYPDTQKTILSWLRQPMRSTTTRDGRHAMEE